MSTPELSALDLILGDGSSTLSLNAWNIAAHAVKAGQTKQARMALSAVFRDPHSNLSRRSWDAAHAALNAQD